MIVSTHAGTYFKHSWCVFDLPKIKTELHEIQNKSEDPDLWNDRENAQRVMKSLADLREEVEIWDRLQQNIQDALELAEFEDPALRADLEKIIDEIESELSRRELSVMLAGPYDKGNAILTINSGAGGVDSQDWAMMLERMYLRWAERHAFEVEILDRNEGDEAGIKTVTMSVNGRYAYGYLRAEKGVHRLVRLSPFDAAHRRHTSFAQVQVLPEIDDDNTIVINPEDLRIDVYRSSGAGGQNVQKNSTAIRLLHIPTGIIVTCQNERSQMQNRENALRVLRSRLYEIAEEERQKELAGLRGEYQKTEWGSQIRSYVLHPYQMVKDHRTEYEVGNAQGVLEGDLDGLIEAFLKSPVSRM